MAAIIKVPNSPTGQVLEAGPDWPVLDDVDDWTGPRRVFIKDQMRVRMAPRPT